MKDKVVWLYKYYFSYFNILRYVAFPLLVSNHDPIKRLTVYAYIVELLSCCLFLFCLMNKAIKFRL